jgi:hypothetical protein
MRPTAIAILSGALLSTALFAQEAPAPQPTKGQSFLRRFSPGLRISAMGLDLLETKKTTVSYTELEYDYSPESKSARVGGGPALEFRATRKMFFSLDLLHHRFGYKTTTEVYAGVKDPNASTDERKKTTILEKTRASFWDLPVLARYSVFNPQDERKKAFVGGGFVLRRVRGIHTATETTNPDSTTCCTETPATPSHRSAGGVIASAGWRLVDDLGIKVIPEVRYTHWLADTFAGPTGPARKGELQILVGITF